LVLPGLCARTTDGLETRYDFGHNAASALSSVRASWRSGTPPSETLALEHRYIYDSAGRPASVEAWHQSPGHFTTGPQLSVTYGYDDAGPLDEVAVQVPSTPPGASALALRSLGGVGTGRVALARDAAGRLERMDFVSPDAEQQDVVRKRTAVTYQPASSRLATIRTGAPVPNSNAVTTPYLVDLTYSYDPAGRITAQETGTVGQPGWWKRSYQYDPASRLTEAKEYVPSSQIPLPWLNRWAWTYNTAGERTGQTVQYDPPQDPPPVTQLDQGYSWDAYGVLDKTYPANNPAGTADDFTFDAAGNLQTLAQANGTILSFTCDPSGRTKTVSVGGTAPNSDGTVVTYRYGPDERLSERTVDLGGNGSIDSVTRYFSDGLISWEIDGISGNLLRAFVFLPDGFTPLMIVTFDAPPTSPPDPPAPQPGTIYFVHNDHLSTPKAVTDLTGIPVWLARHEPFGQVQELCGGANGTPDPNAPPSPCAFSQPLRFPGQWDQSDAHLALSGVWYNWHRFYLPAWGMYSRRDPIVRVDGREFGYVGGQPGSWSDPTGLMPWGGSPDGSYEAGLYSDGNDVLRMLDNAAAGFTDVATLGLSRIVRDYVLKDLIYGGKDVVDYDSTAYDVGGKAAQLAQTLLTSGYSTATCAGVKYTTVSHWGRSGLQEGDWVMKGGKNGWNYVWSGKWQPGMGNEFAPYKTGREYLVPSSWVHWPQGRGFDGWVKGLFGQRKYY